SQRRQHVATPSDSLRSSMVRAPRSVAARISRSVTALQMQTYMALVGSEGGRDVNENHSQYTGMPDIAQAPSALDLTRIKRAPSRDEVPALRSCRVKSQRLPDNSNERRYTPRSHAVAHRSRTPRETAAPSTLEMDRDRPDRDRGSGMVADATPHGRGTDGLGG